MSLKSTAIQSIVDEAILWRNSTGQVKVFKSFKIKTVSTDLQYNNDLL